MNILSTNGFVGRYVTDWAGPAAVIQSIAIRLGAPNYPNDTMVFSGEVTEVVPPSRPGPSESGPYESSGARGTVAVRLQGRNSLGNHVTGTVRISLPSLPSEGAIDVT